MHKRSEADRLRDELQTANVLIEAANERIKGLEAELLEIRGADDKKAESELNEVKEDLERAKRKNEALYGRIEGLRTAIEVIVQNLSYSS